MYQGVNYSNKFQNDIIFIDNFHVINTLVIIVIQSWNDIYNSLPDRHKNKLLSEGIKTFRVEFTKNVY